MEKDMLAELHTYLSLIGNQRLPHLEEEIFADETATTIYLHNLCRDLEWFENGRSNAWIVFYYTRYILKSRWISAEPLIATDPFYTFYYARHILRSRWVEAEAVIATDPDLWEAYTDDYDIIDANIRND